MGTAFLVAHECGIPDLHKEQILNASSTDFVVSRAWTGKTTRSFNNVITQAWKESDLEPLQAPLQKVLIEDLHQAAYDTGRSELWFNPAGQIGGMLTEKRPAREILINMVEQAAEIITNLQSQVR